MAQPISGHDMIAASRPPAKARTVLLWGGVVLATIVLLATFALWFHYGTTVFFEMIAAGFAACF
jgi:cytochrome c-type biogenesis protein CcmH/NrfF